MVNGSKGHKEVEWSMGQEIDRSKGHKEVNSERLSSGQKANGPHIGRTVKRLIGQKATKRSIPKQGQNKLVPLAPSIEIGAGPGQRIPMEIPGYGGSLLVLKYSNMSTRTVDCNP